MMGASGCKRRVLNKTIKGVWASKTDAFLFFDRSGSFPGHFSKTAAPLHPNLFLLFNFNKLNRVQSWVQAGCNGCKLGATLGADFPAAPKNNIEKSARCQIGCSGAPKNVPCLPPKHDRQRPADPLPDLLAGKNLPRMSLLEIGSSYLESPMKYGCSHPVLSLYWGKLDTCNNNGRNNGISLPHIIINCAVRAQKGNGMVRASGRVFL
jgi:hypothetical protein